MKSVSGSWSKNKEKKKRKKIKKKEEKKEDIPGRNTKQIVIYMYYFLQSFKKVKMLFIM